MTKSESPVMYLGPTIRGVVKYGAVFSGGIPKRLEKLARKKPIVKQLIVPLSDIVKAKTAMTPKGRSKRSPTTRSKHFQKRKSKKLRKENKRVCLIISMESARAAGPLN